LGLAHRCSGWGLSRHIRRRGPCWRLRFGRLEDNGDFLGRSIRGRHASSFRPVLAHRDVVVGKLLPERVVGQAVARAKEDVQASEEDVDRSKDEQSYPKSLAVGAANVFIVVTNVTDSETTEDRVHACVEGKKP